jgi:hypothetical protein
MTVFLGLLALPAIAATPDLETIPYPNAVHRVDNVVIPSDSQVRFSGVNKTRHGGDEATFKGRFLLTGTYYYGDNDFNDSGDAIPSGYRFDPEVIIIPDDSVEARLPHFANRSFPHSIYIRNAVAFAEAVVPKESSRRVRCRQCGDVSGHVAIWVDQLGAEIACDKPNFEARFLSLDKPALSAMVERPSRAC